MYLTAPVTVGKWIVPATQMRRQWPTWKVPEVDTLCVADNQGAFTQHSKLHMDCDGDPDAVSAALPAAAMPVDTKETLDCHSRSLSVGHTT